MNVFCRGLALGALSTTLVACGGGQSQHAASTPGSSTAGGASGGVDIQALMARESQGLAPRKLAAQGARAEVLSSADPKLVVEEGRAKVVIPIGGEADVQCLLYEQDPLPGSTFVNIVEAMKQEFEVQKLTLQPLEVVKESPVTKLDIVYATKTEGGKALGQLKLAFHFRLGSSSLCMHDEIGYQKSFAEAARSFFETYDRGNPGLDTSYVEIFTVEDNDRPIGYNRNLVYTDKGTKKVLSMGLLIIQNGPTEITAQDSSSVITLDNQDRIEQGRWVESLNGVLSFDVQLERVKGNRYRYKGTRRGSEVKGEVSSKDPLGLPSSLWAQKELKTRLAKPGAFTLKLEQYRPDDDPAAVSSFEIVRRAEDPPRVVRVKVKSAEVVTLVDEQGHDQRSEVVAEGRKIVLERTFERGK